MRQVVLDTETTGLEPELGHRIIEIGCVELQGRRRTGRRLHHYVCPDRAIDPGALEVHGITSEFLADQPRFAEIADDLLAFIDGAELVIHNAAFDVAFLDAELALLPGAAGRVADRCRVLDTLMLARQLHPGQRNSLDALCKRYQVDNSKRDLHGALLDAELLLDVYLAMTGGQGSLVLGADDAAERAAGAVVRRADRPAGELRVQRANAEELAAHEAVLDRLDRASGGRTLFRQPG
jgi:DNA polymerase III subunit epsilon